MINDVNDAKLSRLGITSEADGYITNAFYMNGISSYFFASPDKIGQLHLTHQELTFTMRDGTPIFELPLSSFKARSVFFGTILKIKTNNKTYTVQPAAVGGGSNDPGPASGRRFAKYIKEYQKNN